MLYHQEDQFNSGSMLFVWFLLLFIISSGQVVPSLKELYLVFENVIKVKGLTLNVRFLDFRSLFLQFLPPIIYILFNMWQL